MQEAVKSRKQDVVLDALKKTTYDVDKMAVFRI
nr:MAG TPA: hypothetical protein [Caudoviricetes sp.]